MNKLEIHRKVIAKMIIGWSKKGAAISKGKHGKMCNTCAFKENTEANNSSIVLTAADFVCGGDHAFYCHENDDEMCVGYLYAVENE